jgi:hypothetical protein
MCVVRLKDHVWDAVPACSMLMSSSSVSISPSMGIMVPARSFLLAKSPCPLPGEAPIYTSCHICLPPLAGIGLVYLVLGGILISVSFPCWSEGGLALVLVDTDLVVGGVPRTAFLAALWLGPWMGEVVAGFSDGAIGFGLGLARVGLCQYLMVLPCLMAYALYISNVFFDPLPKERRPLLLNSSRTLPKLECSGIVVDGVGLFSSSYRLPKDLTPEDILAAYVALSFCCMALPLAFLLHSSHRAPCVFGGRGAVHVVHLLVCCCLASSLGISGTFELTGANIERGLDLCVSSHSLHRSRCAFVGRGAVHTMHLLLVGAIVCSLGGGSVIGLLWCELGSLNGWVVLREFLMASSMSVGFHQLISTFSGAPSSDGDIGPGCKRL